MAIYTLPVGVPDVPLTSVADAMPYQAHEANIEHEGLNSSALQGASADLGFFRETVNADNAFRGNMNAEHRAATHDRLCRERFENSQKTVEQRLGSAMAKLRAELQLVERNLEEKAGLKPNPSHFDAITSAFYQMSAGQRAETLNGLVEQNENAALATLAEAPLFLTGLLPEQRDTIRNRVLEKADPVAFRLRNAVLNAMTKVEAAGNVIAPTFAKLLAGTEPGAAKSRAEMAAARNMTANAGHR